MTRIAPRAVQFKTRPETEKKDERSLAGRIAAGAGAAAVLGGAYLYNSSRPSERKHANYIARAQIKADPVRSGRLATTAAIQSKRATKYTGPMQGPTQIMTGPAPKKMIAAHDAKQRAQTVSEMVKAVQKASKQRAKQTVKQTTQQTVNVRGLSAITPRAVRFARGDLVLREYHKTGPIPFFGRGMNRAVDKFATAVARNDAPGFDKAAKAATRLVRKPLPPEMSTLKAARANSVKEFWKARQLGAITPRAVHFQDRNRDGTMGVSTNPLSAYRKASRIVPWVNRGAEAAGDLGDMAAGKKVRDPFYKKAWFKRAALTAAVGVPLIAGSLAKSGERKLADNVPPPTGKTLGDKWDRAGYKMASAKQKIVRKVRSLSAITPRAVFFATVDPLGRGWDLRDARGKSARVYAPGSRRRDRREKDWGEKTENIRLVRNVAIAGTVAGVAGAAVLGSKAKTNARTLKTQYRQKIAARGGPRMPAKVRADGAYVFPTRP